MLHRMLSRPLVFSVCQRSLKFRLKSNERSISVSSDQNRPVHSIGLPKFAFPLLTNQFTALLLLCKEFGIWLARFNRKFLGYSHIWSTPHVVNAILGHYARLWIFWQESFEACKQGSWLATSSPGPSPQRFSKWRIVGLRAWNSSNCVTVSIMNYVSVKSKLKHHPPGIPRAFDVRIRWTKSSPGRGIWSLLIWGVEFDC